MSMMNQHVREQSRSYRSWVLIQVSALGTILAAIGCSHSDDNPEAAQQTEAALAALMEDGKLPPEMMVPPSKPTVPSRFCFPNTPSPEPGEESDAGMSMGSGGAGGVTPPVKGPIPAGSGPVIIAAGSAAPVMPVGGGGVVVAGVGAVGTGGSVSTAGTSAVAGRGDFAGSGSAGTGSFPGSDCSSEPIGFWQFDDCNDFRTDLRDSSNQSHSAFRTVPTQCTNGQSGLATRFATADDLVYAPDQPDFNLDAGVTVAAWVKPDYVDRVRTLFRKRDDVTSAFALVINAKRYQFIVRLASGKLVSTSAPAKAGSWTHVAATYDGQYLRLYLDGLEASHSRAVGQIAQGAGPLLMGNDASGRRLQGAMDEAWFNTLAAPADTVLQLTCLRHPPTLTVDPLVGPAVTAGTTVTYTATVTNHNDSTCGPEQFLAFASTNELLIDNSFVPVTVATGGTAEVPFRVSSDTELEAGIYDINFNVFSFNFGIGVPVISGSTGTSTGTLIAVSPTSAAIGRAGIATAGPTPTVSVPATPVPPTPVPAPPPTPGEMGTSSVVATYTVAEPTGCHVSSAREIMIRDIGVVDDPVRTSFAGPSGDASVGAWSFGRLMERLSATPADAPDVTEAMFRTFLTPQVVNSFTIPERTPMDQLVLQPWPRSDDGKLDLAHAPMRLLAIVSRLDLKDLAKGKAGEGRFVFGVIGQGDFPMEFTVIFEYLLPANNEAEYRAWADTFHALQALPFPSEEYNAALQAITDRFTATDAVPSMPNGSALIDIRTNEIALSLDGQWQLREFHISPTTGFMEPATLFQTPDSSFNFSDKLARFINANEASILAETHEAPALFEDAPFQAASVFNNIDFWNAPGISNPEARHKFSLNTCNGCHGAETNTGFLQIFPRSAGQRSTLSGFLTGITTFDIVTGAQRRLAELARRRQLLEGLLCTEQP